MIREKNDEMVLKPSTDYCSRNDERLGFVTLPGHPKELATHALILMLAGTTSRWKQVIGFHFTGNKVQGSKMDGLIDEIFFKAEAIGLNIDFVTSDMGGANRGLFKK